jgi:hypothetical protein
MGICLKSRKAVNEVLPSGERKLRMAKVHTVLPVAVPFHVEYPYGL